MSVLGYSETDRRLAVRIRAHTEFANFQLENWLHTQLDVRPSGRVLEVGCGDGNLFGVWANTVGAEGTVVGFDVSDSLLRVAQQRARSLSAKSSVFKSDFDQPFPLRDAHFDSTISAFAAYYATDAAAWISEVARVTRPGGQILVLGPTEDNAAELYALNERVTGIGRIAETDYTTARLAREFLPLFRRRLGASVASDVLDRRIEFPSRREFAQYYQATWLYEKTCNQLNRSFSLEDIERAVDTRTLSKQLIVIEARA